MKWNSKSYIVTNFWTIFKISSKPFLLSFLPIKTNFNLSDLSLDNFLIIQDDSIALGSLNIDVGASGNFSEYITENSIDTSFCQNPSNANNATNSGNVYDSGGTTDVTKKTAKWSALLNNKDYLNCKGQNEQRNFTVFKIASQWTEQPTDDDGNLLNSAWYVNTNERDINGEDVPYVLDEIMYIGRIQMNLNDGKKRKYLYFQTDYKLFKWTKKFLKI